MKFLTKAIEKQLAKYPLYSQDGKQGKAIVSVKFFYPMAGWRWYITEYNPETGEAFGMTCGRENEMGYISLQELKEAGAERDLHFSPKPLAEALKADGYSLPSWWD